MCLLTMQALATRIEPGLEQQIVLPQDSYLQVCIDATNHKSVPNVGLSLTSFSLFLHLGLLQQYCYISSNRSTSLLCSEEL